MIKRKPCVAMLLAGGQGSRLYVLTSKIAKPALPFGSKYRIIDFTLSNCINSGIDTVGVLTQYQPLELNDYIGNGQPWDLDRNYGGVHVLPPYMRSSGGDWYKGTANAVYQNRHFIERYDPDHVLVLSGDHIYKMDYAKMLKYHMSTGAACTIAVIDVPIEDASRFGIMTTDSHNRIEKFEEKPKVPKSTKASMGVYIFDRKLLFEYLAAEDKKPDSANDFGKNIIPAMLADQQPMYAYSFGGYWKDVGTIASFWEANMDLLGRSPAFDLSDPNWKIYYRHIPENPQYIGVSGRVTDSVVAEGCEIEGQIHNSVIFGHVTVHKDAVIKDSVVMQDCVIESDANIRYSILDAGVHVGSGARIGAEKHCAKCISVIGAGVKIKSGAKVGADRIIEEDYGNGGDEL